MLIVKREKVMTSKYKFVRAIFMSEIGFIQKASFHKMSDNKRPEEVIDELQKEWDNVKQSYKKEKGGKFVPDIGYRADHLSYMETELYYVFMGVDHPSVIHLTKSPKTKSRGLKAPNCYRLKPCPSVPPKGKFPLWNITEEKLLNMSENQLADFMDTVAATKILELFDYFGIPKRKNSPLKQLRSIVVREIYSIKYNAHNETHHKTRTEKFPFTRSYK